MVIDLKMCRFENVPWGFRLVGGCDYEYPLTVVKVTADSIAEQSGLQVGDIIVRINDIAASTLTHNDAHDVISHCGNTFFFGIMRESENDSRPDSPQQGEHNVEVTIASPPIRQNAEDNTVTLNYKVKSPQLQKQNAIDEEAIIEQEIAEILTEEREVLKEHNVVGIFPKSGVCMASKVLRHLNEDATKTREEIMKEQRRWTTFLQKPDRPIPKSKEEIELEKQREQNPYKVCIKRQPKASPDRGPTPPWRESTREPEPEPEAPAEEVVEEPPIADTEVPDLTPLSNEDNSDEVTNEEQEATEEIERGEEEEVQEANDFEMKDEDSEAPSEENEKTEEELQLEKQLQQVQQQLLALSNLPTTIQATLDAVTRQLAELLPAIKQQQTPTKHSPVDIKQVPEKLEKIHLEDQLKKDLKPIVEEQEECNAEGQGEDQNDQPEGEANEHDQLEVDAERERAESEQYAREYEQNEKELEKIRWDSEQKQIKKEEQQFKKQKIEVWNRLFNGEDIPRQTFRNFNCASLAIQLERKVNFMKYQKPEKKVDLDKSEVFKILHNLDKRPKHGIEVRPPIVPSEEDIRNVAASCG